MNFEGAEIIAWVGSMPILAADVLYEANRQIEMRIAQNPGVHVEQKDIAKARVNYMRMSLTRLIETKLIYLEAARNVPADAIPKIEKSFNDNFEKSFMRKLMESEGCGSRGELEAKYRRYGTTVESFKRMTFESNFAARWMEDHVKSDDEITHQDMLTYYTEHHVDYEKPRRARWEHLLARFDKFGSKTEAFAAIAQWGNEVLSGASFAEVAKAHSQDLTADDGGVHPWTNEGSLRSTELNKALFELPVDKLSQIIEDSRGFHIIRVIERRRKHGPPLPRGAGRNPPEDSRDPRYPAAQRIPRQAQGQGSGLDDLRHADRPPDGQRSDPAAKLTPRSFSSRRSRGLKPA